MITLSHTTKVILSAAFMSALLGACRKTPSEQSNTTQSGATTTAPSSGATGGTGAEGSGGTATPAPAPGTTPETPMPAPGATSSPGYSPRAGSTGS